MTDTSKEEQFYPNFVSAWDLLYLKRLNLERSDNADSRGDQTTEPAADDISPGENKADYVKQPSQRI